MSVCLSVCLCVCVRHWVHFHWIGPLGRFGLVVAMSVCMSVCMSPSHAIFFKCWCQNGSDVECCYSLILINSWEKHHHYLLLFSYDIPYLIIYMTYFNKSGLVLLHSPRLDFFNLHWTAGLSQALQPTAGLSQANCTALHCTSLHFTALPSTSLYCTSMHCTALHFTAHHCTSLHCFTDALLHCCTTLQCTALHCTALNCTALHCTALCSTALLCTLQCFTV